MIKKRILVVTLAILAMAAGSSAWAQQFARPNSTTNNGGWTVVNAATHHGAVDEVTADNNDYINSGNGLNSTVIMTLSGVTDPGGANLNDHILRFHCRSLGSGGPERCNVAVYDGGTLIFDTGNNSANRDAFATYQFTIPDASTITNYANLSVQITSASLGGSESIQISWVELQVPGSAATPPTVTSPTFANVTDTTATLGGTLTATGGAATTCGVEWGTTSGGPYPNPVTGVACSVGVPYTTPVTGLPSSTQIYFRARATNSAGTSFSAQNTFTTAAPIVTPTVTVAPASGIGQNSATLGGNVTTDGGASVTARGIVWNTTSPAEAGGTVVPMGAGLGAFSQSVSGLPGGTQIFFKAYATNSAGTAYSTGEESFTTLAGLPTVNSPTVANVTATTATLGGTVQNDGGATVTSRGIEWGTTAGGPYPNSVPHASGGTGLFTVPVTGLPTGTVVYFRAWAVNSQGTAYSAQANFTPAGPPVVTATPATNVLLTSATLGGNVTSSGGSTVTSRGIVWDTVSPPEAAGTVVPIGSGTGTFSRSITGLPAATQIFWKAYGTNAVATGYSAQETFTTLSEPTVQASNLAFPTLAGRSMRITWTRGNGEGVIVVMRLQATGRVSPQDGNDYVADTDFTLATELPGNSGNFVVYKGPGTSVNVNGLTMSTNYTVAVYEYAGTGANSDYLLTPLVEGSATTTNYAVHNYDWGVNCDDCHNHGTFGARGPELKAVCESCHNASGQAAAKLEFDNHLTPGKNPAIEHVDCGSCHELHNPSGANTTLALNSITSQTQHNKSFLRANVNKYVSTAATPAFLHNDTPKREAPHPDAPRDAITPERAVEGGNDTTARGYCQVCHTLTNYHRSSNTAGADQCHDGETGNCGPAETHCGNCHQHNNKFIGVGGSVTCVQCHDSIQGTRPIITTQFDRLSTHVPGGSAAVTQEDCLVCHDQGGHQAGSIRVWNADDGTTSYAQPTAGASTLATGQGEVFAPHCMSCHGDGVASSLPASGSNQTQTSPFTGSGAPPVINPARWNTAGHNRPVATAGGSPVSCVGDGANGCHASGHGSEQNSLLAPAAGAAVSPTDFCYVCHDANGPSSHNIQAQFNTATNYRTTANGGALVNQRHDIIAADQSYSGGVVSCKDCHAPHADNATNPVSDPDTGLALRTYSIASSYQEDGNNFAYNSGGNFDPVNPAGRVGGPYSEPDYIQFCLTCHDGTTPAGVTMSPGMINIAGEWGGRQHGGGNGSTGTRVGKGNLKVPWTTQAQWSAGSDPTSNYAALNCTTCHGAHGTGNIFNLRESINVGGVQLSTGCPGGEAVCANSEFAGIVTTSYTLPVNGGSQNDHQWGAWCTFCHNMSAHAGVDETTTCTSAHMHGSNSF